MLVFNGWFDLIAMLSIGYIGSLYFMIKYLCVDYYGRRNKGDIVCCIVTCTILFSLISWGTLSTYYGYLKNNDVHKLQEVIKEKNKLIGNSSL